MIWRCVSHTHEDQTVENSQPIFGMLAFGGNCHKNNRNPLECIDEQGARRE